MLSAIGSSSLAGSGYSGNSLSGLDVQLDKYNVQLADWVNCPSCKTPEGKAKIQELSDKIAAIKQKIRLCMRYVLLCSNPLIAMT
jgi:hypothetical protein